MPAGMRAETCVLSAQLFGVVPETVGSLHWSVAPVELFGELAALCS